VIPAPLKKWLAFGSGVGIQIVGPRGAESLRIAAARVRPGGARLRGGFTIDDFPHQPAGQWGTDYAAFVRRLGLRHVGATVVLPRADVIVRPLVLPGVSDKDLESAVHFQMDGLHPYNEDDVYSSWTRLRGTPLVLVAVVRRDVVDRYAALFEEAGIKIGAFSCSAAAVYSALRLHGAKPAAELLAYDETAADEKAPQREFYGESPARPLFSATFDVGPDNVHQERAAALAAAELRIDPNSPTRTQAVPLARLLGGEPPVAYAAAMASACPVLSLPLNLLPPDRRQTSSALRWVPSTAFALIVLLLAGGMAAMPGFQKDRYLRSLNDQIKQVKPQADRVAQIDKQIDVVRGRIQLLDDLRRHTKADIDVLAELTRLLPPPTWLNGTDITARQVVISGETNQAEPLLKVLDASPLFESSEFQMQPVRTPTAQMFRIKTNREGALP
jgi:Tfp pilus assembly protein PilN